VSDIKSKSRHILKVKNLKDVFNFNVSSNYNVILHSRALKEELFNSLAKTFNNTLLLELNLEQVTNLKNRDLPEQARLALNQIIKDMSEIEENTSLETTLRVIPKAYGLGDAYGFHVDGGGWQILASYNSPGTEGIKNNNAHLTTLSKIKAILPNFLFPNSLYYKANDNADIFSFSPGDIWAQAGTKLERDAFIHRAPKVKKDDTSRLLLVAREPG
jgi:hypothetical protein